jgi:hypothetical protein
MEKDNFNEDEMSTKRHLQNLVWEGLFNSLDNKGEKKKHSNSKQGKQKSDKEGDEGKKINESDKDSEKKS